MENKKLPVDRGKLLIGLECCREQECNYCPYDDGTSESCDKVAFDSLSYICYLEEQLKEARDGT